MEPVAVELDDQLLLPPDRVDEEALDEDVGGGQRQVRLAAEFEKLRLEVGADVVVVVVAECASEPLGAAMAV